MSFNQMIEKRAKQLKTAFKTPYKGVKEKPLPPKTVKPALVHVKAPKPTVKPTVLPYKVVDIRPTNSTTVKHAAIETPVNNPALSAGSSSGGGSVGDISTPLESAKKSGDLTEEKNKKSVSVLTKVKVLSYAIPLAVLALVGLGVRQIIKSK